MTIASKVTVFCILLVFLVSTLIGATFYYGNSKNLYQQAEDQLTKEAQYLGPHLLMDVNELSNDANYLSELPVLKDLILNTGKLSKQEKKEMISPFLMALLASKKKYLSVKIIDSSNRAIHLNIHQANKKNKIKELNIYEKANINFKIDDYPENRAYLSSIKLYRNNLDISGRRLPVMEAIKPITVENGKIIGLIVVTTNLSMTFQNLKRKFRDVYQELYLTNNRGDYLINPFNFQTFGFESGKNYSLQKDFIKSIDFFTSSQQTTTFSPGLFLSNSVLHLAKIKFDKFNTNRFLILGLKIDMDKTFSTFNKIRTRSIILAIILLIIGGISAYYFINLITSNLWKITQAAKRYGNGEPLDLNINSSDEVGVLANTFAFMIKQITDKTNRLRKSDARNKKAKEFAQLANKTKDSLLFDLKKVNKKIEKLSIEKDDLMAIVSHDLKNPLSIISANLDLLSDKDTSEAQKKELVQSAIKNSKYAINLITDLLDLSKIEAGIKLDFQEVSFIDFSKDIIENHSEQAMKKNIKIKYDIQDDITARLDKNRFTQVLNNLISNAIKFTALNGNITLKCSSNAQGLIIKLSDDGVGIPYEKLSSIFNKYQQARTSDSIMGSGLGLAICKNIVEAHKGTISVDSVEFEGATFTITLPHLKQVKTKQLKVNKKILIVDDDEDLREILRLRLEKNNFVIQEACHGVDALQVIPKFLPELVILDLEMPILNGEDTLKKIRKTKNKNDFPVLIHSGNSDAINKPSKYLQENTNGFINKNSEFSVLLEMINSVLSKKTNILLIDDSEDIYNLYNIYLKKSAGINLDFANNGKKGIELLKINSYDLIFLDLNMPGFSGTEVLKEIRKSDAQIPIIANSSLSSPDQESKLLNLGFTEVLDKQMKKDQLLEIIGKYR
jgi:signal transduction histidine kinase/DNA-binding response OmpR family regulator